MSCVYRGPVYPMVEEGVRLFTLRYQQVVSESLPLLRNCDSVTVKTGTKELTAWQVAAGYPGGVRYYLGMDGVIYVFGNTLRSWVAVTPETCAQLVRLTAWMHDGRLCVARVLERFEDILDAIVSLAQSLQGVAKSQYLVTMRVREDFCI